MKPLLPVCALALAACATAPSVDAPRKPAYLDAVTQGVPNEAAITHRYFTPGLEDGFVPQGLTFADGHVLVAGYRSADPKVNTGPCRVFRIDAATGAPKGAFDVPVGACTHGGGLAWLGGGMLMVADTRQLFRVDLARALEKGRMEDGLRGAVRLAGALRGSFAAHDGRDAWIGTWTKDAKDARMFRLPADFFDRFDGKEAREDVATGTLAIPVEVQGAAFDRGGKLWVSASASRWGKLYRLDRDGKVEAEFAAVPGIEDIEFDASGGLWAVSESGTKKYMAWVTRFPYVFRMDVGQLR